MNTPFHVSRAAPQDHSEFARLFPELGVPEQVPSAERFADTIAPHALFLREGAAVVGYAWARPRSDTLHVVHVITDPAHRRRGVGRALMDAIARRARLEGFHRWMLHVKPENVAARALYERCGMAVVLESVLMRLAWTDVPKLVPAPSVARPLDGSDDARFEDALSIPRGEIAAFRSLPGRIVLGAEESSSPVGFVAFDPAFPGAPAFRTRTPTHARTLLDAIRPHALPQHDHVLLFVEGNQELELALASAGATAVMRTFRMEGEIA